MIRECRCRPLCFTPVGNVWEVAPNALMDALSALSSGKACCGGSFVSYLARFSTLVNKKMVAKIPGLAIHLKYLSSHAL